ncbi:MAG: type II toxin-antitoxin system VapC family toxin [Reyranella sp.]|uniref:type II toxin-antitoxin system VapC family toxin n=1 Tax=Reyranella sp. TaxID=1929291 RepID=UPI001AD4450A|nr:type II toxin-antitoxin system VapC family toxin [Reyranella sp.]MBN9085898.1 type II toxin-antitoxin system VapC family toxin [Reyranella sp.]
MNFLLDTHVLLWAAGQPEKLSRRTRGLLNDPANSLLFSAVSLWEIVIKQTLGRDDFNVDPRQLRRGLLDNDYGEIAITSAHALAVEGLPPLHRDPFDRMLLAQTHVEGFTLLTADAAVLRYAGLVQKA